MGSFQLQTSLFYLLISKPMLKDRRNSLGFHVIFKEFRFTVNLHTKTKYF